MAITSPVYATREDVKGALDSQEVARNNPQIDVVLEAASRSVEGLLHRVFYPTTTTKYFDWPDLQGSSPWRLWLDQNEVITVSSLVSGSSTVTAPNYFLEPANYGPPYDRIEINLGGTNAAFSVGSTHQRAVAVTGVFGYQIADLPAGALTAVGINTSVTSIACTDSSSIGVGSLIKVDSEYMLVTEKTMVATGQSLSGSSLASMADVTQAVGSGAAFTVGEVILMGSERMLIVDISGNNLTVKRAWDGTVLATHASSAISAPRTLTVVRGVQGSTAASHLASAVITTQGYPSLVRELCIGEALNLLLQRDSGYARTSGQGDNAVTYVGRGLDTLRHQAVAMYGRKARTRAV